MFQFFYNVIQAICISVWFIMMTIITGKMVKVSPYHFDYKSEDNTAFDICNDIYIETNRPDNVSDRCKRMIIQEFVDHLKNDKDFFNIAIKSDYPIFDGGEIIGSQTYENVLNKSITKFIPYK